MVNPHMNFFVPYDKNGERHEDHLTRSLMLILKYSDIAKAAFYELIRKKIEDENLKFEKSNNYGIPSFFTLKKEEYFITTQIGGKSASNNYDENQKIISILLTDNDLEKDKNIKKTEKKGVFDGLVKIDFNNNENEKDSLVFVIENKPSSKDIWKNQLNIEEPEDKDINKLNQFITIEWKEIISLLRNLRINEYDKNLIFDDFYHFVFKNYPSLFPYDTFKECRENPELIEERIRILLENIVDVDCLNSKDENSQLIEKHSSWAYKININNTKFENKINTQIDYPYFQDSKEIGIFYLFGSRVSNSRELIKHLEKNNLNLKSKNDFKVKYIFRVTDTGGRGLFDIDVKKAKNDEFISYWIENKEKIKQYKSKPEFENLFLEINEKKFLEKPQYFEEIYKKKVTNSNRTVFNVSFSLLIEKRFSLEELYEIEKKGKNELQKLFIDETVNGYKLIFPNTNIKELFEK